MRLPAAPLPDLRSEEDLRRLLAALERYGFSIEDVPRPEIRERLRELQARVASTTS